MNEESNQVYAIVPAAGASRRMGRPKLLLPFPSTVYPGDRLIDRVLRAWTSSRVDSTVVVVRNEDEALIQACEAWPVNIVRAKTPTLDMKASVQLALRFIQSNSTPIEEDRFFVAPADLPGLNPRLIDRLLDASAERFGVVVPRFGTKTSHPALLPWKLSEEIFELEEDAGINQLVNRHTRIEVPFASSERLLDVDTPEEYQRLLSRESS